MTANNSIKWCDDDWSHSLPKLKNKLFPPFHRLNLSLERSGFSINMTMLFVKASAWMKRTVWKRNWKRLIIKNFIDEKLGLGSTVICDWNVLVLMFKRNINEPLLSTIPWFACKHSFQFQRIKINLNLFILQRLKRCLASLTSCFSVSPCKQFSLEFPEQPKEKRKLLNEKWW